MNTQRDVFGLCAKSHTTVSHFMCYTRKKNIRCLLHEPTMFISFSVLLTVDSAIKLFIFNQARCWRSEEENEMQNDRKFNGNMLENTYIITESKSIEIFNSKTLQLWSWQNEYYFFFHRLTRMLLNVQFRILTRPFPLFLPVS